MSAPSASGTSADVTAACAIDDNFAPHFAACAASIAASRGSECIRFLLVCGRTLTSRTATTVTDYVRDLGLSAELLTIPDEATRGLPEGGLFSPLVWYRMLLPTLLPDYKKILSIDADTLVLQSIAPLYGDDLSDNLLSAVASPPGPAPHFRGAFAGLPPLERYFNAGVMMLNLEAMREANIGRRAIALGHEKGTQLIFAEQDAFNHLARNRWQKLHPRWNALSYLWMAPNFADDAYTPLERETARISPAVVHFEGGIIIKPWYFRSSHPLRDLYWEYRQLTPWPVKRLQDVSLTGAALRKLPFTWQYAISRYKNAAIERMRAGRRDGEPSSPA